MDLNPEDASDLLRCAVEELLPSRVAIQRLVARVHHRIDASTPDVNGIANQRVAIDIDDSASNPGPGAPIVGRFVGQLIGEGIRRTRHARRGRCRGRGGCCDGRRRCRLRCWRDRWCKAGGRRWRDCGRRRRGPGSHWGAGWCDRGRHRRDDKPVGLRWKGVDGQIGVYRNEGIAASVSTVNPIATRLKVL